MNLSTPTMKKARFGLGMSALGFALAWPKFAHADQVDTPPHRLELSVSPGLSKCNDYDSLYGIITNWVTNPSIDPTAKRKVVVTIKRRFDGGKKVDLSVLDPEGIQVGGQSNEYPASEECFKVLYWAAFDGAYLMRATIPPEEPDDADEAADKLQVGTDKLVEQSEKKPPVHQESPDPAKPSDPEPSSTPICQTRASTQNARSSRHLVIGGGLLAMTRVVMPGLRIGVGRSIGPLTFELDARIFPPLVPAEMDMGAQQRVAVRSHAYLGAFAVCARKAPLSACAVAMGGVSANDFKASFADERFSRADLDGLFSVGLRTGVEIPVSPRFAFRLDAEAQLPLYQPKSFRWDQTPEQNAFIPILAGFVSFVPSF
ncbi:MAG: hypothetical protein IPM54_24860 [Polyangiaceae bacterium]|nr:hypothetical protein [Polyangiaceae bacterium]